VLEAVVLQCVAAACVAVCCSVEELAVALPQIGACIDNSRQYSIALRIYRNTE